jgi:hypothetical protein
MATLEHSGGKEFKYPLPLRERVAKSSEARLSRVRGRNVIARSA